MNLKELSSPIRLYWDIAPGSGYAAINYSGICGQIIESKILSLQVTEHSPCLSDACLATLDALNGKAIALSLTAPRSALSSLAHSTLRDLPLKVLFAEIASTDELDSVLEIKRQMGGNIPVGISLSVTRGNHHQLPAVLSFCFTRQISHLQFPMQRITRGSDCFYLTRQEGEALSARLQKYALPPDLKLIIHDPFLWKVFYPSVSFPNGGCQAANTMLYLSPEADVYPCPTMPVKIGSLLKASFKEIVRSDTKSMVRRAIITAPEDCGGCADWDQCGGGCRGRAYAIHNSWAASDPACS